MNGLTSNPYFMFTPIGEPLFKQSDYYTIGSPLFPDHSNPSPEQRTPTPSHSNENSAYVFQTIESESPSNSASCNIVFPIFHRDQTIDPAALEMHAAKQEKENVEKKRENKPESRQLQKTSIKVEKYKTELCLFIQKGQVCNLGKKCVFAHSEKELRKTQKDPRFKTVFCRSMEETGSCPYNNRCKFAHTFEELKKHRAISPPK